MPDLTTIATVDLNKVDAPPARAYAGTSPTASSTTFGRNVERTITGAPSPIVERQSDGRRERNAILLELHKERRHYERRARVEGLSANDASYLRDINALIDKHEQLEARENAPPPDDVWARLDRLATKVLAVDDEIEALKR